MDKQTFTITLDEDKLRTIVNALLTPEVVAVISVIEELKKQTTQQSMSKAEGSDA